MGQVMGAGTDDRVRSSRNSWSSCADCQVSGVSVVVDRSRLLLSKEWNVHSFN
jgi:hypothetical protein